VESLYLLIPLSAGLVLIIIAVFGWAVHRGQFEELDAEAERILTDETPALDGRQGKTPAQAEES
jgi:cbb3-type cytochrome oxidase maturation protein